MDKNRRISPLIKTKDSILINTSKLSKKACFKNNDNNGQKKMEVYKDLKTAKNQEFEKLLNSQLSKIKLKKVK